MRAVLLLCLLAFMTCEKDIIDIGKCIYKAPKVQELISDVIVAIATQDFSKLLPKIKEAIPELIQIVLGCLTDTKAIEEQPKLEAQIQKTNWTQFCTSKCYSKYQGNIYIVNIENLRKDCISRCGRRIPTCENDCKAKFLYDDNGRQQCTYDCVRGHL